MKKFMYKLEDLLEIGGIKKDITLLVISGIAVILSLVRVKLFPFDMAWIAIVLCGIPIILEAVIGLVTEFDIKADVLVSLALVASICIGEDFAAGEVAVIMQLGGLLEELTVAKARAGIEKLVNLTPQTARVIKDGKESIIPAKEVNLYDELKVLPGETVPVDGVILRGQTSVNQAVMTGESLPVDKTAGDEVFSGAVNQFGAFTMRATKVGEDSSLQRMIRLVQSADAGKAKIVGIADRWATWIVVIALTAAVLTWLITGEILRAVTILVVFCPCALVLATPTAIMAAIGNATKHGFLVREGDALERLSKVSKITFDKTGTLTYGTPEVIKVVCEAETIFEQAETPANSHNEGNSSTGTNTQVTLQEMNEEKLYSLCAAVEQSSEHPLGKAVVRCYKREYSSAVPEVSNFHMVPGRGVSADVEGHQILAGNLDMLHENCVEVSMEVMTRAEAFLNEGCTIIYVAANDNFVGFVVLSDTIRKESEKTIKELLSLNVQPILLTGDNEKSASTIAGQLGITEVHANCLPEDKLKHIEEYRKRQEAVCMIGDGINDAPALKAADVGIAMGGVGSDIAVDAADIALIDDEVKELPHLLALSKRMMTTIKINMSFSMGLNFVAIILAIIGTLNPVVGALVHNAGSVLVIINSALLLKWKMKRM